MDSHLSLACPFKTEPQPTSETEYMRDFTRNYLTRHALFTDIKKYTEIIVHYGRFCTPPDISREALKAVCMYLAWVCFIDDHPKQVSEVDTFSSIVVNNNTSVAEGSQLALAELVSGVQHLAKVHDVDPIEFNEQTIAFMLAQQWEHVRLAKTTCPYSEAEYLRYRPDTIATGAFIALLKLDAGIEFQHLNSLTNARGRLLEQLCIRVTYLANDILSYRRDQTDLSALSIVRLLSNKHGISWLQAVPEAISIHNQEMTAYVRIRDELQASQEKSTVIEHLIKITDVIVAGNIMAMECLRSRYQVKDGQLVVEQLAGNEEGLCQGWPDPISGD